MGMSEYYGTADEEESVATLQRAGARRHLSRHRRRLRTWSQRAPRRGDDRPLLPAPRGPDIPIEETWGAMKELARGRWEGPLPRHLRARAGDHPQGPRDPHFERLFTFCI